MMKIFTLPVTLLAFILTTATVYATQTISIKGFAYSVEKPDMAHVFIKITGEGKNYTASEKEVNRKLSEIKDLVREILGKDVSPIIIKTESKVKSKFNTGNYEEYTQEYFLKMAKAIKGDISEKLPLKEEEYTTIKNIYFSTSEYSTNQLDELKNTLASKKLAFNEADILAVSEIYPAGETPIAGITGRVLAEAIRQRGHKQVFFCPDQAALKEFVADHLKAGDLLVTLGAGNICQFSRALAAGDDR